MQRIVVGVDGSETSKRALAFAIAEARSHGGAVEAVMVNPEPVPLWASMPEAMYYPVEEPEVRIKETREHLVRIIDEVSGDDRSVEITPVVEEGPIARRLLGLAEGADLLVVGSRGLGGFRNLMLGSVSHQCVSHAPCPVVVIPPVETDD
ncbi:MAG: universal stress protein [Nitriliruptorales bacterium]|nr:universal stress protein [Nitriliruptorales bacterium]